MRNVIDHLSKSQRRTLIEQGTEASLRAGGEIKRVAMGVSGLDAETKRELRRAAFPEPKKTIKSIEPMTPADWAYVKSYRAA